MAYDAIIDFIRLCCPNATCACNAAYNVSEKTGALNPCLPMSLRTNYDELEPAPRPKKKFNMISTLFTQIFLEFDAFEKYATAISRSEISILFG